MKLFVLAGLSCLTLLTLNATASAEEAPERILFVGNSYLYYGDSLHNHVRRIAGELGPYPADRYVYKSATIGGARLEHHPLTHLLTAQKMGVEAPFQLVVLQGGSAETLTAEGRQALRQAALEHARSIKAAQANTALYMTPAYVPPHPRYAPDQIRTIASTYVELGRALGASVIPVGLAFEAAYAARPDMQLHKTFDGSHPSLLGTYLAACVVYQSLYRRSVQDTRYTYFGAISEEDAVFLRRIADQTVTTFLAQQNPEPALQP